MRLLIALLSISTETRYSFSRAVTTDNRFRVNATQFLDISSCDSWTRLCVDSMEHTRNLPLTTILLAKGNKVAVDPEDSNQVPPRHLPTF